MPPPDLTLALDPLTVLYAFPTPQGGRDFRAALDRLARRASLPPADVERAAVLGLAVGWQPRLVLEVLEAAASLVAHLGADDSRFERLVRLLVQVEAAGTLTKETWDALTDEGVPVGRYLTMATEPPETVAELKASRRALAVIVDGLLGEYGGMELTAPVRWAHLLLSHSVGVIPAWGPRCVGVYHSAAQADKWLGDSPSPFVGRRVVRVSGPAAELPPETLRAVVEALLGAGFELTQAPRWLILTQAPRVHWVTEAA